MDYFGHAVVTPTIPRSSASKKCLNRRKFQISRCGIFCRFYLVLPRPRLKNAIIEHEDDIMRLFSSYSSSSTYSHSLSNAERIRCLPAFVMDSRRDTSRRVHAGGLCLFLADSALRRLSFKTSSTSPLGTFKSSEISSKLIP